MRNSFAVVSRSVIAALVLLAATGGLAFAQEHQPAVVFEEIIHDFGTVFAQASYKHTFVVKNEGKADLLIKEVKPG
ncbi:MAG: DUF1573 domain-containing protein [Chitinivibrionia bacterium]|nr:DUF1573 domain-containing protein [Chitinivibrionia bacterium]